MHITRQLQKGKKSTLVMSMRCNNSRNMIFRRSSLLLKYHGRTQWLLVNGLSVLMRRD